MRCVVLLPLVSACFALFEAHGTAVFGGQVDRGMMDELKQIKQVVNPTEVLLVVDAMTGQEAAGTKCTYQVFSGILSVVIDNISLSFVR